MFLRSLEQIKSDHVTLLEFLLSLISHQIKMAVLIATHEKKHLQLKSKEDSEYWIIRKQLSTSVCFIHINLCHFSITMYSFTQVNAEYPKCAT